MGNFVGHRLEIHYDEIVIIGNFSIYIFTNEFSDEMMFKMEGNPMLLMKERKNGIAYFKNASMCVWYHENMIYVKIMKNGLFRIEVDYAVKKIVGDVSVSGLYLLGYDGVLRVLRFGGSRLYVLCDNVIDFNVSFCERYVYVMGKNVLRMYEENMLVDEVKGLFEANFVISIGGFVEKIVDYINI